MTDGNERQTHGLSLDPVWEFRGERQEWGRQRRRSQCLLPLPLPSRCRTPYPTNPWVSYPLSAPSVLALGFA